MEYLRNIILQFLEHQEMRVSAVLRFFVRLGLITIYVLCRSRTSCVSYRRSCASHLKKLDGSSPKSDTDTLRTQLQRAGRVEIRSVYKCFMWKYCHCHCHHHHYAVLFRFIYTRLILYTFIQCQCQWIPLFLLRLNSSSQWGAVAALRSLLFLAETECSSRSRLVFSCCSPGRAAPQKTPVRERHNVNIHDMKILQGNLQASHPSLQFR